jgi:site-specific recombinase XerD
MPRQTDDQQITTRAARERLAPRAEPYWRAIDTGAALGYRKTDGGGFWVARVMIEGRYRKGALGRADDALRSEGVTVLEYRQATDKAKAWAAGQHRIANGMDQEQGKPYTVADAMTAYLDAYRLRGGKAMAAVQYQVNSHILPALGAVRLDRLTRQRVEKWRDAIATAPPRLRSSAKPGADRRHREIDPTDAGATRARRATANRILTTLKAALNHAHHARRIAHDDAWKLVKPFAKVDSPRVRWIDDAEVTRLLNACTGEFRKLVAGALLTGMRYSELTGMKTADLHANAGTISLSTSKGGKPRLIHLTEEGRTFFAAAVAGKGSADLVLRRSDGEPWGKSHHFRPLREACANAKITPAVSFHILRHTYASRLVMRGVPIGVVAAQIGDSEAITSKHYAHLAPSYVGDMVRQALTPIGAAIETNVTPMRSAG